jgi:pimeloyl-ACP methyl ester carboxylesterase
MPAVFVHGVPETPAVWEPLRSHLSRHDITALQLPGFGCPSPTGFGATKEDYVAWLVGELEQVAAQGPIDLVGHDWGGGHVMRLAMERPDLIRSWASDIAGAMDPDYEWHDMARTWQTRVVGEAAVGMMVAAPLAMREAQFVSLGLGSAARAVAEAVNADMGRCILALYRSAAQPAMRNWGKELAKAAARPGLVIAAEKDTYVGGEALARRSAGRCRARVVVLAGRGHWWMCEDPALGAQVLDEFFAQ